MALGLTLSDVVNPKNLLDLTKAAYGVNKQMEQIQAHLFDGNIVALKNDLTKLANQAGATKAQIQDLYHQLEALPSLSDYDKGKMIGSLGAAFAPTGGAFVKLGNKMKFLKPVDKSPNTNKVGGVTPKSRPFGELFQQRAETLRKASIQFNRIGKPHDVSGGLAGAIRHTKKTGQLVGGSDHIQKGQGAVKFYNRQIKQIGNSHDIPKAARQQLIDIATRSRNKIQNALNAQ